MAETSGLLNRRTGITRTEGSNPSVSARALLPCLILSHVRRFLWICEDHGQVPAILKIVALVRHVVGMIRIFRMERSLCKKMQGGKTLAGPLFGPGSLLA